MSSQPVPSLAQAGSGHWKCPLYEEEGGGKGCEVIWLKRGMRAGDHRGVYEISVEGFYF